MMLAGVLDVFSIIVGVICALVGMAMLLLGLLAVSEKAVKQGVTTSLIAGGLMALGLWLIGVIG